MITHCYYSSFGLFPMLQQIKREPFYSRSLSFSFLMMFVNVHTCIYLVRYAVVSP